MKAEEFTRSGRGPSVWPSPYRLALLAFAAAPLLFGCATASMWGTTNEPSSGPVVLVATTGSATGADGPIPGPAAGARGPWRWLARYSTHGMQGIHPRGVHVYYALPVDANGTAAYPFEYEGTLEDLRLSPESSRGQRSAVQSARLHEVTRRYAYTPSAKRDVIAGGEIDLGPLKRDGIVALVPWPRGEAQRPPAPPCFPAGTGVLLVPASQPRPARVVRAAQGQALLQTPLMLAVDAISLPVGAARLVGDLVTVLVSRADEPMKPSIR